MQWEEDRPMAYHVRRRLTEAEALLTGPVRDLRGSAEGRQRFERIAGALPTPLRQFAMEELLQ